MAPAFLSRISRRSLIAGAVAVAVALTTTVVVPQVVTAATRSQPVTIWGEGAPASALLDPDPAAVTLGTRFTASVNGQATGIRFYKTAGMTGKHTGLLWNSDGALLARVTFTGESATGWQTAQLSKPVQLSAGRQYTVAYRVPQGGRYAATVGFSGSSSTPQLSVANRNAGTFTYGSTSSRPKDTWRSSQYWVDITFVPSSSSASPSPTASSSASPSPSATPRPVATAPASPAPQPPPVKAPTPQPSTPPSGGSGGSGGSTGGGSTGGTGAFPTAATAGLPAGWKPATTTSGDMSITTPGAVVQDLRISNAVIYVEAPNVTLRRIEGTNVRVFNTAGSGCNSGLVVEDSTFHGSYSANGDSVIGDGGYTVRNVVIDNAYEGLRVGYADLCGGVTVENTYIKIVPPPGCGDWHGDGIQGYTGGPLTVRNSVIDFDEGNGCYGTAAFFYPAGQGNTSVDINGLIVQGGGYPFRLGTGGSVRNLFVVRDEWGYGPTEVNCGLLSAWQAQTAQLNGAGQPVNARPLTCG